MLEAGVKLLSRELERKANNDEKGKQDSDTKVASNKFTGFNRFYNILKCRKIRGCVTGTKVIFAPTETPNNVFQIFFN